MKTNRQIIISSTIEKRYTDKLKLETAELLRNGIKFCPSCQEPKNLVNFTKNKRTFDSYSCYCRGCQKDIRDGQDKEVNKLYQQRHYINKKFRMISKLFGK